MTAPTITLPTGCKPWEACSEDQTRPVICHGYLRERDGAWWLLTTDSYIACALKVETTGDVREGWVSRNAMEAMHKAYPVRQGEQVSETAWKIRTNEGHQTFDLAPIDAPKGYPDMAILGMWEYEPGDALDAIGLDPRFLSRLVQALGFDNGLLGGVELRFTGNPARGSAECPIRVTGGVHFPERIGLQMPVRLDVLR